MIHHIRQLFWLLKRSIYLDIVLLVNVSNIAFTAKLYFIYNKYISIINALCSSTKISIHKGRSFHGDYYFKDEFSTGLLQSIYCHNYLLKNHLPNAPIIVDIGANIGQFSTFSAHYLGASNIISFEPIKECFNILKMNNKFTSINIAIGAENGQKEIFIDDRDIFASLVKPEKASPRSISSQMVSVLRIDEVKEIFDLEYIDLLKIDTEGYEFTIIKNSPLCIKKSKYILIECSLNRPNSGGVEHVCKYMIEKFPELQIVDIFSDIRKENKLEWVEILWKNMIL